MANENFEQMGIEFQSKGVSKSTQEIKNLTAVMQAMSKAVGVGTVGFDKMSQSVKKTVKIIKELKDDKIISLRQLGSSVKGYKADRTRRVQSLAKDTLSIQDDATKDIRTAELLNKTQRQIVDSKIKQNTLVSQNTKLQTQNLKLKTKQLNSLSKNKSYIKQIVKQEQARQNLQKTINDALVSAGLKTEKIKKNSAELNQELNKTEDKSKTAGDALANLAKKASKLATAIYTAKKLARVISELVQESGSWIENLNLFAVTFGESSYREILNWTTEYADKLGVANNEILKMTGYFKQLSSAIGITGQQGDTLSKTLTQLTYDFGSFYNVSFDAVYERLQAGIFSGQVRTLRTLGIDISQASIQNLLDTNEALEGLNLSATKLTQTQKVLARTILTMQAGSNAFGDLARSIDTLQNRQRVFTASIQNLKLAMGDFLAGPANDFLAYGIAFVQTMTSILRTLAPLKTELEYDIGDNVFTEVSEDIESVEESLGLLSFDKFQSLSGGDKEQTSATEALNDLLEQQILKYNEISSQFDGIDEKVKSIKDTIWKWIFPNTTSEQLKDFVSELGEGATTSEKFNAVVSKMRLSLQSFIEVISRSWQNLKLLFEIVAKISKALSPIIEAILTFINWIVIVLDKLGLLKIVLVAILALKFASAITKWVKALKDMKNVLGPLILKLKEKLTVSESSVLMFRDKMPSALNKSVKMTKTLKGAMVALKSAMAFLMAFSIADSILGELSGEGKKIASIIFIVVGALTALVATIIAVNSASSWGAFLGFLPAIMAGVGVAVAGIKGLVSDASEVSGYATGGIPDKSEFFYMNEHGIPEALVNTGGRETNVINQQQLGSLVEQGFVRAIYSTGLLDALQNKMVIEGKNINDSAFARAIFPALKTESERRGGNQL